LREKYREYRLLKGGLNGFGK